MSTICIYHGNCADGFGAAWAARKALGEDVVFHSGVYQMDPPDVTAMDVVMVDFSYKRPVLVEMAKKARSILILDHHKSAAEDLEGFALPAENWEHHIQEVEDLQDPMQWVFPVIIRATFDMERSGAAMAWDFFHDAPRPVLIDHIQDHDLWQFKLDGTREIQAAVFSFPYDFDVWDRLMETDTHELRQDGKAIERKHFKDIEEFTKAAAYRMEIAGYDVPVLNAPYMWSSDAAHEMAKGEPFAACYWDVPDGRVFSLRSADDGMDVSEIAKKFGGGGHQHAAGYKTSDERDT